MAASPPAFGSPLLVALAWIEAHCVVPDGFYRGMPFRLYDFQLRYLAEFYRVRKDVAWLSKSPVLGPAFVYRRGMLVLSQKSGKSPLAAAHLCLEAVGPALFGGWAVEGDGYACSDQGCSCGWEYAYEAGEPMGMPWPVVLAQITAMSEEQTQNTFDALRPMIEQGPLADLIPKTGEEFIRLPNGGRIDVVTSSATSRLGQRVTFCLQDEVGLWTATNKMVRVADTQYRGLAGMGGRASLTTNAWDPTEHSVAQQQYESSATDIYRQFEQAPAHLSYRNKVERRRIHKFAYGAALKERGGHIDLDAIEAEAADLLERDPAQAERFFGNRLVAAQGTWLAPEIWEQSDASARTVPDGSVVCAGFDGSDSDDFTALRLETMDGHSFTPTYGPDGRSTIWDPAAWGGTIPRAEVHAAVDEVMRRYHVLRMYCDPREWRSEIGEWALAHGEKVVVEWPTNQVVRMHAALERTLTDIAPTSGRMTHDGCKITELHVGHARKAARPGDRYILAKPSPTQKIDVCVAMVLAHEAASDARTAGEFERAIRKRSAKVVVMR